MQLLGCRRRLAVEERETLLLRLRNVLADLLRLLGHPLAGPSSWRLA